MLFIVANSTIGMNKQQFDPLDSLIFLTNRVGRLLSNCIRGRAKLEDIDLLPTHMGVLVDLWVQDGLRQQDLALSAIKDKGTIARAIDSLERENMVVRVPDEKDKRNKRIYLTYRGRALQEKLHPHAMDTLSEATDGIPEEELRICKSVLHRMYNKLSQS